MAARGVRCIIEYFTSDRLSTALSGRDQLFSQRDARIFQ